MSRVFVSRQTGAAVVIFSADHCPPHVHARHRGEGWVARVGFSYLSSDITLLSVMPVAAQPTRAVLRRLLDDVRGHLSLARSIWWDIQGTTCLENRFLALHPDGAAEVSTMPSPAASRLAAVDYDPDRRCLILWVDERPPVEVDIAPQEVGT